MLKQRIWEILEIGKGNDQYSKMYDYFISALITLNVVAVIFETEKSLFDSYEVYFLYFELFSISIFSVEYLLRLWSCVSAEAYRDPITGRIRYFFLPWQSLTSLRLPPST